MTGDYLAKLGNNLRAARKRSFPKDDLTAFAIRIGVSRATLQKMEKGDMSVSLKRYYQAAQLLGMESQIESLFFKEPSLFDRYPDALIKGNPELVAQLRGIDGVASALLRQGNTGRHGGLPKGVDGITSDLFQPGVAPSGATEKRWVPRGGPHRAPR